MHSFLPLSLLWLSMDTIEAHEQTLEIIWDLHTSTTGFLQPAGKQNDTVAHSPPTIPQTVVANNAKAFKYMLTSGCDTALDVVLLQDLTGSYQQDLPVMNAQLPGLLAGLQAVNPSVRVGGTSFHDKPFAPLGELDDYCYKVESPLSKDTADLLNAYKIMGASGGMDLPESQFTALINTVLDTRVGWTGEHKLIIMITDAQPHIAGDPLKYSPVDYPDLPRNFKTHLGTFTQSDPSNECLNYDYPSAEQVRDVLHANNVQLAFITPDEDANVVGAWKWVNEDLLGQSSDMYVFGGNHSSQITEAISSILTTVFGDICVSTAEPTSTIKVQTTTTISNTPEATSSIKPSAWLSTFTSESNSTDGEICGEIGDEEMVCCCHKKRQDE